MCTVFRMVCMVGISVILASGPAWAKPGEIVQWLMDRPLTLWDMGVIRIEEAAEKAASRTKLGSYDVAVHYVWDYDEITVSFSVDVSEGKQHMRNVMKFGDPLLQTWLDSIEDYPTPCFKTF